jgi:cytochrome c oxidase cbb3-type subunit 3
MARFEDRLLDHEADGIQEYDNPPPVWFNWIFYGAIVFSVLYVGWYALSFGDDDMIAEYQREIVAQTAAVQAWFDANPIVPPTPEELLAGALDPAVLAQGAERYRKTCAACHGEAGQGLIGPNLTDEHWLHGGKVTQIFESVVKGIPAKGMPPWGRALAPEELRAVVSYIRSLSGTNPAGARGPEGDRVPPEPLPTAGPAEKAGI